MLNRTVTLIWLRAQMLLSNKNLLIQIAMPYALALLYKKFLNPSGGNTIEILFTCLGMSFAFSLGNMVSNIISEEKEKNNLKTLILSGVGSSEYIISTLFFPIILGVLTIVSFPLLVESNLGNNYLNYWIVSVLTAIAVVLLNLSIALLSSSQSKTQINTLPVIFITSLLPMFSLSNHTLEKINSYSFMGSYTEFFVSLTKNSDYSIKSESFYVLLAWLIVLLALNMVAFKMNLSGKVTKKTKKLNLGYILLKKSI